MTGKRMVKAGLYLLLTAAMSIAIFGFLAGVSCRRLEEYRLFGSSRQQRLEFSTCRYAADIMQIYLSQGMDQVEKYVYAENVSFVIQKTSGRRLGGNYRTWDEEKLQRWNGQALEYIFWFSGDELGEVRQVSEESAEYMVKIAYFTEEQIQAAVTHLDGIQDDLSSWITIFFLSSGIALVTAVTALGWLMRKNGPNIKKQQRYAGRLFRVPLEKLALWLVAAVLVWLRGYNRPYVWEIPITWEDGPESMLRLLGESIKGMTLWGLLLGILLTGFVLHLSVYIRWKPDRKHGLADKLFKAPKEAWEHMSWLWKVLTILLLTSGIEAAGIGLVQYGAGRLNSLEALKNWLAGRSVWIIWFLWILEKLVLAALALRTAESTMRLRTSAEELAKGNLGYQIPLEGMTGELLQFGRDMNAISHVVAAAVEDQTRSEHLKTELVTNVSHDIKTPLTSIINYADLIGRESSDNEKITEYAQVLHRQSTRLKKLIEDLMEVSKAATGNLEMYLERCQAGVLLSQAMGEFEQRLRERGIEVIIRQGQEPVWILADPRMLWRILDNLMTNICKYAQSDTRVYLILETQDNQAVLTFKNISSYRLDMDASELMERFVRGDRSRHTEGSGLGLSIARSLAELQGGSMHLITDGDLFKVILVFPIAGEEEPGAIAG